MSVTVDRSESVATQAACELAQLRAQTEAARVTLTQLQHEVVEAEIHLSKNKAAQLLEANEQLVVAALRAQTEAEIAARALNEVSRSAELDVLTELPNRVLLLDRFAQAIAIAKRHHTRLALLFLDLNNFKQINDTLGHAVGDQVLRQVAHCLTASVRAADTVSRHGGDEFLILLTDVAQASDAVLVADKIIAALNVPSRFGDQILHLTASIGISLYPDNGEQADTLIDRADAAMYHAKRHGLGSFCFHSDAAPDQHRVESPALASHSSPFHHQLTHHELALVEHECRQAQLCEANQQLVGAALRAQELQAAAEQAQRRQLEIMAVIAHELRSSLTPIRIAASLLGRVPTDEALLLQTQTVIEKQLVQVARLVNKLLHVSQ